MDITFTAVEPDDSLDKHFKVVEDDADCHTCLDCFEATIWDAVGH
jgi:hypothetical protein